MDELVQSLSFFVTRKNTIKFILGRSLTKQIYSKIWRTTNMSDDYDIGIVAFLNGEVVGNINIQFKFQRKKLPSELFFSKKNGKISKISIVKILQNFVDFLYTIS
jgi:hypothetical protein